MIYFWINYQQAGAYENIRKVDSNNAISLYGFYAFRTGRTTYDDIKWDYSFGKYIRCE